MTKYHSRAEINQNTAKMDADDKRAAAGRAVTDPSAARDFTATSLWVPETQAMPVATASDLGVLALSLVRHLLEPIKAKALREPEAAKDELAVLFAALPVPDARDLTQTVKDLKNLTPGFRQMLQTKKRAANLLRAYTAPWPRCRATARLMRLGALAGPSLSVTSTARSSAMPHRNCWLRPKGGLR